SNVIVGLPNDKIIALGNSGSAYFFELEPMTQADLSLEKTIELGVPITRGDTFTYFLTVKNNGPNEAVNVVVTDELPSVAPLDVTFVDVTPGAPVCTFLSGTVTCNLGNMAENEEKIIAIIVKTNDEAPRGGIILNEATVSSDTVDSDLLNDKGMVSFPIKLTVWDGGGDGINWSDPLNWNTDEVPVGNSQILIQDATGIVHLNVNHEIIEDGFLIIFGSNTLEIDSAKKLTNNSVETILISSGATLINKGVLENFALIINKGEIINQAGAQIKNEAGSTFSNDALVDSTGDIDNQGSFTNMCLVNMHDNGIFGNNGLNTNTGLIIANCDGEFVEGPASTINGNIVVQGNCPEIPLPGENEMTGRLTVTVRDDARLELRPSGVSIFNIATKDFTDANGDFKLDLNEGQLLSQILIVLEHESGGFYVTHGSVTPGPNPKIPARIATTFFDTCVGIAYVNLNGQSNLLELNGGRFNPPQTNVMGPRGPSDFIDLAGLFFYTDLAHDFLINTLQITPTDIETLGIVGFSTRSPAAFFDSSAEQIHLNLAYSLVARNSEGDVKAGQSFLPPEYQIDTLFHEWGHYVVSESKIGGVGKDLIQLVSQQQLHPDLLLTNTGTARVLNCHFGYGQLTSACALNEGLATFLSSVINQQKLPPPGPITELGTGSHKKLITNAPVFVMKGGTGYNLEVGNHIVGNKASAPPFQGQYVWNNLNEEFAVSSVLWDLYDPANDDTFSLGIKPLWDKINSDEYVNVATLHSFLKDNSVDAASLFGAVGYCEDDKIPNNECDINEDRAKSNWNAFTTLVPAAKSPLLFNYPDIRSSPSDEEIPQAALHLEFRDDSGQPVNNVLILVEFTEEDGTVWSYEGFSSESDTLFGF
ncbi:MAG: DUF11 domain-containing protein, partial [Thaumarchaeota archaeon]|nr:DUF11 domain-containing protein [Nitrososphaerota archaeon]